MIYCFTSSDDTLRELNITCLTLFQLIVWQLEGNMSQHFSLQILLRLLIHYLQKKHKAESSDKTAHNVKAAPEIQTLADVT